MARDLVDAPEATLTGLDLLRIEQDSLFSDQRMRLCFPNVLYDGISKGNV
jgi:hypothetical protein